MAQGSWLKGCGTWPRTNWRGSCRPQALGPNFSWLWALSHEPWGKSLEPWTIDYWLIHYFQVMNEKFSNMFSFHIRFHLSSTFSKISNTIYTFQQVTVLFISKFRILNFWNLYIAIFRTPIFEWPNQRSLLSVQLSTYMYSIIYYAY